jgi:L-threonylcarbamoyladenylate synthase
MAIVTATPETVAAAARLIAAGELVAFPTETVYGLGADTTNGLAVARIFEAKGRPRFNPLIAHAADIDAAFRIGRPSLLARRLGAAFWPGPLTLVLPLVPGAGIADLVTAGLDTVAVRVPSHPVAQELIRRAGVPVAAPSANRSGHVSPTSAEHVAADLGDRVAMILDGGPTDVGVESTVIDATTDRPRLLRAGGVTAEAIAAATGIAVEKPRSQEPHGGRPSSPGQLVSHYAPRARVRLAATSVAPGEALLAFGPDPLPCDGPILNLSLAGDLVEAAKNLFSALRTLDATGAATIAAMPIPRRGLGAAINDRLARAAAER